MARQARTHFAILGLLCWKPMSGYDIRKMVEAALIHFWNESYGQIYPALNRLVDEGLATKEVDRTSGGRCRKVYRVTPAGRNALEEWLRRPTPMPRLRDELKLKFFLTSRGDRREALRLVEEYGSQQREHLEMLRESETVLETAVRTGELSEDLDVLEKTLGWAEESSHDRQHELLIFLLTLRSGILVAEARCAWAEECRAALTPSSETSTDPDPTSQKGA